MSLLLIEREFIVKFVNKRLPIPLSDLTRQQRKAQIIKREKFKGAIENNNQRSPSISKLFKINKRTFGKINAKTRETLKKI